QNEVFSKLLQNEKEEKISNSVYLHEIGEFGNAISVYKEILEVVKLDEDEMKLIKQFIEIAENNTFLTEYDFIENPDETSNGINNGIAEDLEKRDIENIDILTADELYEKSINASGATT